MEGTESRSGTTGATKGRGNCQPPVVASAGRPDSRGPHDGDDDGDEPDGGDDGLGPLGRRAERMA